MKLPRYLKGRKHIDIVPLLEVLDDTKERQKPGALDDAVVLQLIESARTIDDVIATAHLVRSYANRQNASLFRRVAEQLENVQATIPAANAGPIQNLTILTSVADSHHIKLVYAYVASLLVQPQVQVVRLVFSGEWIWNMWQRANERKFVASIHHDFRDQLSHYPNLAGMEDSLCRKLDVCLAPRPEEIGALLGDVVLRFEGPAAFKTSFLYGRAVHAARPVVTGTFSSHVTAVRNSDLTLTRANTDEPGCVQFVPPAALVLPINAPLEASTNEKLIVSVYAQERIRTALKGMTTEAWCQIARLFNAMPDAVWRLIGAADPELARAEIPADIERRFGGRIEILAFSDLREIYPKAFAFLALPRVFGGAGGATMAICYGLPVAVVTDRKSDISNTLPEHLQHEDMSAMVDAIVNWAGEPKSRIDFIKNQQTFLAERMDLKQKGYELLERLQMGAERWKDAAVGPTGTQPAHKPVRAGAARRVPLSPTRPDNMTPLPKVFCIGRNKTGTTSMAQALHKLGYKVASQVAAARTIRDWRKRDFHSLIDLCGTADAFQDMPFSLDYTFQALDAAFPGAKFILTVRDSAEQWYASITKFHSKVVGAAGVPPTVDELRGFKGGWILKAQSMIYGVSEDNIYDRDIYMAHYENHIARILDYFKYRPNDLLVMNVGDADAMQKLCAFLNVAYTGQKFPHANSTDSTKSRL